MSPLAAAAQEEREATTAKLGSSSVSKRHKQQLGATYNNPPVSSLQSYKNWLSSDHAGPQKHRHQN